jgi:PAS domain S-box-containing protein
MTYSLPSSKHAFDYGDVARVTDKLLAPTIIIGPDGTLRYANETARSLIDHTSADLTGRRMLALIHPGDRERVEDQLQRVAANPNGGGFTQFRLQCVGPQGSAWRVIDAYAHNFLGDPQLNGILISGEDTTEQDRLSRALTTLTQGNRILTHATDEASLFQRISECIVECGHYPLAWVGLAVDDDVHSVATVAAAGITDYLSEVTVRWGDDEFATGPTGLAIRNGTVQVIKNLQRSKRCGAWREGVTKHELRSACSFPLVVKGRVVGALSIYGSEADTFTTAETSLLGELADDVAYGIARLRDAELLSRNESHLREAERLAHVGHWEWDLASGRVEFMADEILTIYGIDAPTWTGDLAAFAAFVPVAHRDAFDTALADVLEFGTAEIVHRVRRDDGGVRRVKMRCELRRDASNAPERVVGISLDATDYIAAQQQLDHSQQFLVAITNNMTEGMIATDDAGVVIFANDAAARLLDLEVSSIVGHPTADSMRYQTKAPLDDPASCPLSRVWSSGETLNVDNALLVRRDASTLPVSLHASPLRAEELRGAVIVFADITERVGEQLRVDRELEKLAWVGRIRDPLDHKRFVLYAQPIVDLATNEVVQNEVLLRMIGPDGEVILPARFLPTAEEFGLIAEIDLWVLEESARLASLGHHVEFNLSAKSVTDPHMLSAIEAALARHAAPPSHLVCEITETALLRDMATAEGFVRGLNDLGCSVALDDFGAGYGGFAHLKRLAVSYLKIDRQFVADLVEEASSRHVVSAVVSLAHAFKMRTVAEGAEDDATVSLLRELGVDMVQGYVVARPAPAESVLRGQMGTRLSSPT